MLSIQARIVICYLFPLTFLGVSAQSYADICQHDDAENTAVPASAPTNDFTIHGNGTVTHKTTGLMWMRCPLGRALVGGECDGDLEYLDWPSALAKANIEYAGYSDWRVPNKNELASIIEERCTRIAVNAVVFPNTSNRVHWTSSTYSANAYDAWGVSFSSGTINGHSKQQELVVRLVREVN